MKLASEFGDVGVYCLNCDFNDYRIFRIREVSCVKTVLHSGSFNLVLRVLQGLLAPPRCASPQSLQRFRRHCEIQ